MFKIESQSIVSVVAKRYFAVLAIVFLCFVVFCFKINAQLQVSPAETSKTINKVYQIGPGDVIDVVVARNDTLSRSGVRVDNEGKIQLPMLDGNVSAACLTELELAIQIKEKYKKYLLDPHVYVAVKEFNSQPVALIGAVTSPGRFQLQRSVRLLELLTFVNGPNTNAGRTIQIIRNPNISRCQEKKLTQTQESTEEIVFYNLQDTLEGKERANPIVQSGDVIRVVEADQAYVIGNVKSSITVNLNETVTLTQALAKAGGVLPNSNVEKIRLLRQSPGSLNKTETLINLKNINKQLQEDIVLQPNDIVEIPGEGASKSFFRGLLKTIMTGASGLPLRVIP